MFSLGGVLVVLGGEGGGSGGFGGDIKFTALVRGTSVLVDVVLHFFLLDVQMLGAAFCDGL